MEEIMKLTARTVWQVLCILLITTPAFADIQSNYPARKPYIINNCPSVELSSFTFDNQSTDNSDRFHQGMKWKNIGNQPLVAFEIVILKYDAFNRRMIGTLWTVSGKNSGDWTPLAPGESSGDGVSGYGSEDVFTAIAYVRAARLADGTVWTANDSELLAAFRKLGTGIREFGDVKPDPKPKPLAQ
jgi:hypothetical protein